MEQIRVWDRIVWVSILKGREPNEWRIVPEEDIKEFVVHADDQQGATEEAAKELRKIMPE